MGGPGGPGDFPGSPFWHPWAPVSEALGGPGASSAPRGAPGGHSGEFWGPRGIILESSPLRRRLFFVTLCYSFGASAPEGIFAAPEGHAILSIFATLVAPGLLIRHPRIPAGTQSCVYLRHILDVGHRRNFSRRIRVRDLAAICDTCGTWPSHTPFTDFRGHPILCVFTIHSTLPLRASPPSKIAPFQSYAYLLLFRSAKALGSIWG